MLSLINTSRPERAEPAAHILPRYQSQGSACDCCSDPRHGVIFELNVDLGRCKILHPDDPQMKTWQQDYDSAWHPIGAVNNVAEAKEENFIAFFHFITTSLLSFIYHSINLCFASSFAFYIYIYVNLL
jgi:hypothetical protein